MASDGQLKSPGYAPMMEVHVCSQKDGHLVRAFALGDSTEVIIGREESCDIRIESMSVSREHCSIERSGDDLLLKDLESSGGTFMDGQKIDSIRLEDGMEIQIGPAVLKFYESGI